MALKSGSPIVPLAIKGTAFQEKQSLQTATVILKFGTLSAVEKTSKERINEVRMK